MGDSAAIAMVKRGMHGQSSTRDLLKDSKTTTSRPPGYTRVAACKSGVAKIPPKAEIRDHHHILSVNEN